MEKKRVSKIFMEDSQIQCGWLDLNINNDIIIPVSYLNSRFFYDLLSLVRVLNNYCTIGCRNLYLEIDCEGTSAYIGLYTFSESKVPENAEYEELDDVLISIVKECYDKETNETYERTFKYIISKKDFIKNIITFIEEKINSYNIDFCCDGIAEKMNKVYIDIVKRELIDKFRF